MRAFGVKHVLIASFRMNTNIPRIVKKILFILSSAQAHTQTHTLILTIATQLDSLW